MSYQQIVGEGLMKSSKCKYSVPDMDFKTELIVWV